MKLSNAYIFYKNAQNVFALSNTRIVASNPTRCLDVSMSSMFLLCCVGTALRRADPPSKLSTNSL
jgi:hypothetical protein